MLNMIGVHAVMLVLLGRFTSGAHKCLGLFGRLQSARKIVVAAGRSHTNVFSSLALAAWQGIFAFLHHRHGWCRSNPSGRCLSLGSL